MNNKYLQDLKSDFFPAEDELISTKDVPKETAKFGVPTSIRILQRDSKAAIIPKPIRLGNGKTAYYYKSFIVNELAAIHVFKNSFNCTLEDLKVIAEKNRTKNFKDMLGTLYTILEHVNDNSMVKKQGGPLIFELGSNKFLQSIVDKYLEKLKVGWNLKKGLTWGEAVDEILK